MGWIQKGKGKKGGFIARYRDPAGIEHSATCSTKAAARAYLAAVEAAKHTADWVDPKLAKVMGGQRA